MKTALIVVVVILVLALIGAVVYAFMLAQDKNDLAVELQSTRDQLAAAQSELAATKQTLDTTQQTLSSTNDELAATRGDLSSALVELDTTEATLALTQSELASTNQSLAMKTSELKVVNTRLAAAEEAAAKFDETLAGMQKRLEAAQDTLKGLGISVWSSSACYDVELADNATASDPTLKELKAFLSQDKTENHTYISGEYDCSQFSRDLHNHAEAAGIKAAEVQVFFEGEKTGHALNAFLTTDYGLVYIDCTQPPDRFAHVKSGIVFKAIPTDWQAAKNLQNDSWWNSLSFYYYMETSNGREASVDHIVIYW